MKGHDDMRSKDAFPSRFLGANDLKGKEPNVTIESLTQDDIGNGDLKWILKFRGAEKTMILNKTNWDRIEYMYGDSDDWIGCRVQLYTEMVNFQGKTVEAIRIRRPTTADRASPTTTPQKQFAAKDHGKFVTSTTKAIPPGQPDVDELPDDEVPF